MMAVLLPFASGLASGQTPAAAPDKTEFHPPVNKTLSEVAPRQAASSPKSEFLAPVGKALANHGITPEVNLIQFLLGNSSLGEKTGEEEALTLFSVGADFNLKKIAKVPGATLHLEELFVPTTSNQDYGGYVGDDIGGQPPPYIPYIYHLTRATWEQDLLRKKLNVEFGKENMGRYLVKTVCNQDFTCQSPLTQYSGGAGLNPAPYGNWMWRATVNVTPQLHVTGAEWRSSIAFPFAEGWGLHRTNTRGGDYNTAGFDVIYATPNPHDPKAHSYEALFTRNTATQHDPATGAAVHGAKMLYLGGKQPFWVGGQRKAPVPTSLSAFASTNISFTPENNTGLSASANWGIQSNGPFAKRPFDSYSLKMTWMRETESEHTALLVANKAAGGTGAINNRSEIGIGPDANFVVNKSLILCPYVTRVFHANTIMGPSYGGKMQDGWAGGVLFVVLLDRATGLVH